jgi:hypothetical protein
MALNPFEVPLSSGSQQFTITLGNIDYVVLLIWNSVANAWVLDISDQNDNLLIGGIPLVTGVDLLQQYAYVGIGGGLVCTTDDGQGIPDYSGLGTTGHLYFVTS